MPKQTFKGLIDVIKSAFKGFGDDKVTKLSAALAYYTVFSMAPLIIVIISLCSIFLGREAIEGEIYGRLAGYVGSDAAAQLQEVIRNAARSKEGPIAIVIGAASLLLGASTVFGEIQDSINMIWGLKAKPKKGLMRMVVNRLMSFSVIISLGFVLLVSLVVTALIDGFNTRLQAYFPQVTVAIFYIINQAFTLLVVTVIFSVVFKVLPDARIKWKDVIHGAVITAVLFMVGKFGISLYISKSNPGSTFGAAGSLVVLLLWSYYSSLILYFGAEFTKAYAIKYGSDIKPNNYAVTVKAVALETGDKTVQEKEKVEVHPGPGMAS